MSSPKSKTPSPSSQLVPWLLVIAFLAGSPGVLTRRKPVLSVGESAVYQEEFSQIHRWMNRRYPQREQDPFEIMQYVIGWKIFQEENKYLGIQISDRTVVDKLKNRQWTEEEYHRWKQQLLREGFAEKTLIKFMKQDQEKALLYQALGQRVTVPEALLDTLRKGFFQSRDLFFTKVNLRDFKVPESTNEDLRKDYASLKSSLLHPRKASYTLIFLPKSGKDQEAYEEIIEEAVARKNDQGPAPILKVLQEIKKQAPIRWTQVSKGTSAKTKEQVVGLLGESSSQDLEKNVQYAIDTNPEASLSDGIPCPQGKVWVWLNGVTPPQTMTFEEAQPYLRSRRVQEARKQLIKTYWHKLKKRAQEGDLDFSSWQRLPNIRRDTRHLPWLGEKDQENNESQDSLGVERKILQLGQSLAEAKEGSSQTPSSFLNQVFSMGKSDVLKIEPQRAEDEQACYFFVLHKINDLTEEVSKEEKVAFESFVQAVFQQMFIKAYDKSTRYIYPIESGNLGEFLPREED